MTRYVRMPTFTRWQSAVFALYSVVAMLAVAAFSAVEAQATRPAGVRATLPQPAPTAPMVVDTSLFNALKWREIGPARGGRSVAVAGSAQRPLEYWMGTTGGGVFKTTDGGHELGRR